MATQSNNLFLLEDLEDAGTTSVLDRNELSALRAVANWIKTFIANPHPDLGRAGPVCPFVPSALDHRTLWLAPEQIVDRAVPDVVELMNRYKNVLLDTHASDGNATSNVIVVVFTDLAAERAQSVFDDVLQHLAIPSYADTGNLFGPFYEGNTGTAIYNAKFQPFQSPVPFLFVRNGVVGDWKFFLNNDEMLTLWARRFGDSTVHALAEELRHLPWREHPPRME